MKVDDGAGLAAAADSIDANAGIRAGQLEQGDRAVPHVIDNIYYVGTEGLGAYLFTGPKGHVLLDGATPRGRADDRSEHREAWVQADAM
jgi:hypothetical protein